MSGRSEGLAVADPDTVEAVLDWLADPDGAQALFSIGEHYAPYPTEVNDARIRIAAECLADFLDSGDVPPGCPATDATTGRAVLRELDRREAAAVARRARAAEEARQAKERATQDAAESRRREARRVREARQRAACVALLRPDSGACESERAQARAYVARLTTPAHPSGTKEQEP